MRPRPGQRSALVRVTRGRVGSYTDVYLCGSRPDDVSKGGGADILVDVERPVPRLAHSRLVLDFEEALGLSMDAVSWVKGEHLSESQKMIVASARLRTVAQTGPC